MPELRKDPVVNRWVILAPERASRPDQFFSSFENNHNHSCPFCAGNEQESPGEVLTLDEDGNASCGTGWQVRVVTNQYPALTLKSPRELPSEPMFERRDGFGVHEVIVECPQHEHNLSSLPAKQIGLILKAYRDRLLELRKNAGLLHALIFKNSGGMAGASLEHAHSQLVVTPIVPIFVQEELDAGQCFFEEYNRCIFCEMIEKELHHDRRIVLDTDAFVVLCPYASRFPYEMWILPKRHFSRFECLDEKQLNELGMVLKSVLGKLDSTLDNPPYNFLLHTAPFHRGELPYFHWHMEIFPRTTRVAGFEWGSGFYINTVLPEEATRILRESFNQI